MAGDQNTTSNEKPFGVTNIKTHVPLILDIDQLNYDAWSELFVSHCEAFGLLAHLEDTDSTSKAADASWKRLDSLVKVWIYGTISTSLLQTVLKKNATAASVWKSLKDLFHDNKEARALELENELQTLELGSMTIAEYFKKIKVISDLLTNIESPVDEKTLVMHAINGLDERFEHVTSIIRHRDKRPTLLEARSMLTMEESRLARKNRLGGNSDRHPPRDTPSSPCVLVATENSSRTRNGKQNNNKERGSSELCRNFQNGRCTFGSRCRFNHAKASYGNNNTTFSNFNNRSHLTNDGNNMKWGGPSNIRQWAHMPSPHQFNMPRPQWPRHTAPTPSVQQAFGPTTPNGPSLIGLAPYPSHAPFGSTPEQLTLLPQAYTTDTLSHANNNVDNGWYMDSGATSHLSGDAGLLDPTTSAPM